MEEVECFGVDYERYALGKLLQRFTRKYNIKNVLEMPASGVKAMPSIYSLGFGLAGCHVTLVNGDEKRIDVWKKLGLEKNVSFVNCRDLKNTGLDTELFDFVWNFAVLPNFDEPHKILKEMCRVSRKFVGMFSVNGHNVGFGIHRKVHKFTKIPWTHGNIQLNYPANVKKLFQESGLKKNKIGLVDCPPWPDSPGFRDIRLHKSKKDVNLINWHSKLVDYMKNDNLPLWIKAVYFWEKIPVPRILKYFYSHIFYVLGEKS